MPVLYRGSAVPKGKTLSNTMKMWGTRWRSWLKHCAANRKVVASLPHITTEILHWLNPGVDSDAGKNEYQQYLLGGC